MKAVISFAVLIFVLAGCAAPVEDNSSSGGMGMGMGMGGGMMERHHAQVPDEYAGLTDPVTADEESFTRGAALYATHCATCHGDGGMGDGPAGAALDPAPSPVARTSQMMGDDYLFWRISEGGTPFNSAMPAWKSTLDEQARWDVINYVRALGKGEVKPASEMGGAMFDPDAEVAQRAAMLAQAVEQGVITPAEAETFNLVHAALEQYRTANPEAANLGDNATEREAAMLAELVKQRMITQAQADSFTDIHNRLGAAGLMP